MHPRRTVIVEDDRVVVHDYAQHATPRVARVAEATVVNGNVAASTVGDGIVWLLSGIGLLVRALLVIAWNVGVHTLMGGAAGSIWLLGRSGDALGALSDGYRFTVRRLEAATGGSPRRLSPGLLPWLPGNKFVYRELPADAGNTKEVR
jgi:hypothetical protein